ncbi:mRNA 3'-end-processing protein rna14 [Rhynchospora pubera]|uniref:mRNA 3'-end-processing protein rna14 n=1 Tax=Rhynchospora pubera TaxID=906938 RepID=A0AAV8F0Y1_9POAL|nr:mRNA 3'-end-processing protein rna14 [Rhynchospora pubera]
MGDESKKVTATMYNVEASELLSNEAQNLPISEAASIYEKLVSNFPTSAKYWKQYVEAYMAVNNDEAVKQIFSRCLLSCLHINLWRSYINFIRKVNEKKGSEGLEETRKAFDFMLNQVGFDIASGPVWMEYIAFLKSMPATSPQEESQRMTSVRKVYQRAILIPTNNLDQLWRDYEIFENSVSRTLAKGLLSEYQPKFNSAKAVYRERKKFVDDIDWSMLAVPPTGSSKEEVQCMAWKRLLAFEKGNPQRIDAATANRRVNFTYEQCLMYLYHYPEMWYDYAMWQSKSSPSDASIKTFQRALKALPDSNILKYAYAELEESRGSALSAKKIYESLLADDKTATSLAHIQFLRFLRRTEGSESARKYFVEAHKSPTCTYHVFVAFAMMAFCVDKDPKVAQSVFETGLKRFMKEPAYILEYADFLCKLNDDRNVRALFERALSLLPPEDSVEVWKRFVQFERTYGDLSSMLKVEQRRKEALSKAKIDEGSSSALENDLYDVVSRYSFLDLWPCSSKDLDHLSRQEWLANVGDKRAAEKPGLSNVGGALDGTSIGISTTNPNQLLPSTRVVLPDISRMVVYDPRQSKGPEFPGASNFNIPNLGGVTGSTNSTETDECLKLCSPSLQAFIVNLPPVEGLVPDVDVVLSILLQSSIPACRAASTSNQPAANPASSMNQNGAANRPGKRKDLERQDEDDVSRVQSRSLPKDVFRLRQMQKTRGATSSTQTGSAASGGSILSGDQSVSSN